MLTLFFRKSNLVVAASLLIMSFIVVESCVQKGISTQYEALQDQSGFSRDSGKAEFLYGDMGGMYLSTLETNGFVYKVAVLALILQDNPEVTPGKMNDYSQKALFKKYGFLYPSAIKNWPELGQNLKWDKPAGIVSGYATIVHPLQGKLKLEVSNFGCATCHGGPAYDKAGKKTDEMVLGIVNSSVNIAAFSKDLYHGYKEIQKRERSEVIMRLKSLFPRTGEKELKGLKFYVKRLQKEVEKLEQTMDSPVPYDLGGAGYTNGIGAIKNVLSMFDSYTYHTQAASLVSIPGLADRSLRSSLLVSGNYAPEGKKFFETKTRQTISKKHVKGLADIVSIFTIGTMGFDEKKAYKARSSIHKTLKFVASYEGTEFPGKINQSKAQEGQKLYKLHCQNCHGKYSGKLENLKLQSFPNKFLPVNRIKTDSLRAVRITAEDLEMLNKMKLGEVIDGQPSKGYVAPILTDLWVSAPYLHNGSVPTVWHLMHPDKRPRKFQLGGHALDFEKLGIKGQCKDSIYTYPPGYTPWSQYEVYNTQTLGRNNAGHEYPFMKLNEKQKDLLIEFLKTL